MDKPDLCHVIWKEDFEEVRMIVAKGVDLDRQGRNGFTPLMQAAEMENLPIAKFLVDKGADVNGPGHYGATPLHIAVDISIDGTIQSGGAPGEEPLEMIRFLLSRGASVELKDDNGQSPLDWATAYESHRVVGALST